MIHLIHARNRHLYAGPLADMHRQRRDHFIRERGWPLVEQEGGEYDRYDDGEAAYLVGFSAEREVATSVRIRLAGDKGLIDEIFPDLIVPTEQPATGEGVYEATRYYVAEPFRRAAGFVDRAELHLALLETMVDRQARRLIGVMDMEFMPYVRRFSGLRVKPLGAPAPHGRGAVLAFELGVLAADLAWARQALRIPRRQLFEAPASLPADTDPIALANQQA
jgi:N-acyl-L-homoserine lactone synthetase